MSSCLTKLYINEHIPPDETPPAAHDVIQTPCPALQAIAAGGAPTPKVTVPITNPAAV